MNNTLEYYMSLPYTYELIYDKDDNSYFIKVKEFTGCMSQGETPNDAVEMIRDAMEGWISICLEDNMEIPLPENEYWRSENGL